MVDVTDLPIAEINWPAFYEALVQTAPWAMTGLPDGARDYIQVCGAASDAFWSDDLEDVTTALWKHSPCAAVEEAMQIFCGNVRRAFSEMPLVMVDEWISAPSATAAFTRDGCIECIDFKLTDPVRDFLLAAGGKSDVAVEMTAAAEPGSVIQLLHQL